MLHWSQVTNPGVAGMLCLLAISIWILSKPGAEERPKLFIMILGLILFVPISQAIMNAESRAFPLKFDYYLYAIDSNLGISAFSVARHFTGMAQSILFAIYNTLNFVMVFWYAAHLHVRRERGKPQPFLRACLVAYLVAPLVYLIVPAQGPRYAFGDAFPLGNPTVHPALIQLSGWPNAMPSLHVTTALLFVILAPRIRVLQLFAWLYLACTVCATLAFEHYVIDLIVAVPYACFAASLGRGKFKPAVLNFGLVATWLLAIRFATPALLIYPPVLQMLALGTVLLATSTLRAGGKSFSADHAGNRELLSYFKGRKAWLAEPDFDPPRASCYPDAEAQMPGYLSASASRVSSRTGTPPKTVKAK